MEESKRTVDQPGKPNEGLAATAVPPPPSPLDENVVAITGSPNTVTELEFDVRENFLRDPILGTLLQLDIPISTATGEEEKLLVLGQVSHLETKNRWHEDESLKNFIKLRGRLPHLTQVGDFTPGTLQIIGAYRRPTTTKADYEKTRLSVPAGSGLSITKVSGETIKDLMKSDFGYGFLGSFYGTKDVPAPVYIRHFGNFEQNGTGEAYMGGVFGPSGSGKSIIAAELVALYSSNEQMGILILDPQSEFAANRIASGTRFNFDFHKILQTASRGRFNPASHITNLDRLQLEGTEMFSQILFEKGLFRELGASYKTADAIENLQRFFENQEAENRWNTEMSWAQTLALTVPVNGQPASFLDLMVQEIANVYVPSSRNAKTAEYIQQLQVRQARISEIWSQTVELFLATDARGQQKTKLIDLLKETVLSGRIRILDLNPERINMTADFKLYLIDFVFRKLKYLTHKYYREDNPGNCLIVLDEAGRFIPQSAGNERIEQVSKRLTDATKEMRKMRCGFLFITQTIAEIQKEIFRNLHFRIYGQGLGVGVDEDHIKSWEGKQAFDLYSTLPDPRLSGVWPFMVAGALIALGSSGRPMVIESYESGDTFLQNNSHLFETNASLTKVGTPVKKENK